MKSARARRVQEKIEEADGSFMISFWSGFVSGLALLARFRWLPMIFKHEEAANHFCIDFTASAMVSSQAALARMVLAPA